MLILKLFILFSLSIDSYAYFIDYLKVQHAGEIGYIATGVGRNFTKNYSLEYFHGYVPEDIGGHKIETFAIKNNYKLFKLEKWGYFSDIYIGASIYHVAGLEYQTSRHSSFPEEYYRMGSIRGLFYTGFTLGSSKYSKHISYLESGLNDIVLTNYINNKDVLNPVDFVSLGLGYGYLF